MLQPLVQPIFFWPLASLVEVPDFFPTLGDPGDTWESSDQSAVTLLTLLCFVSCFIRNDETSFWPDEFLMDFRSGPASNNFFLTNLAKTCSLNADFPIENRHFLLAYVF